MEHGLRIFDLLLADAQSPPGRTAISARTPEQEKMYTSSEAYSLCRDWSVGLLRLGGRIGERVLMLPTRPHPEWLFLDLAIQQIGALPVFADPNLQIEQLRLLFQEQRPHLWFTDSSTSYEQVKIIAAKTSGLKKGLVIGSVSRPERRFQPASFSNSREHTRLLGLRTSIHPDHPACLQYAWNKTDGLFFKSFSHRELLSRSNEFQTQLGWSAKWYYQSTTPVHQLPERILQYAALQQGTPLVFSKKSGKQESYSLWAKNGITFIPHYRLKERLYSIAFTPGAQPDQKLRQWQLGLKSVKGLNDQVKLLWAKIMIYPFWRYRLGKNIRIIVTGPRPASPSLLRLLRIAGFKWYSFLWEEKRKDLVLIKQSPREFALDPAHPIYQFHLQEIARGLFNLLIRDKGKVLRSSGKTAWQSTEWLFRKDQKGLVWEGEKPFIFQYFQANPEILEDQLNSHPLVERSMITEQEGRLKAFINPSEKFLKSWAAHLQIPEEPMESLIWHPEIQQLALQLIDSVNQELPAPLQISSFQILTTPWSLGMGSIGTNGNIQREVILQQYHLQLEEH